MRWNIYDYVSLVRGGIKHRVKTIFGEDVANKVDGKISEKLYNARQKENDRNWKRDINNPHPLGEELQKQGGLMY